MSNLSVGSFVLINYCQECVVIQTSIHIEQFYNALKKQFNNIVYLLETLPKTIQHHLRNTNEST